MDQNQSINSGFLEWKCGSSQHAQHTSSKTAPTVISVVHLSTGNATTAQRPFYFSLRTLSALEAHEQYTYPKSITLYEAAVDI